MSDRSTCYRATTRRTGNLPPVAPVKRRGSWEALLAGDPSLGLLEIRHPEQASFTREEPQEEPRRPRHPIDIGHDCGALPVAAVLNYEVIAQFGVLPQRGVFDVIEVLDQIERPQPAAAVNRRLEYGHHEVCVVLPLHVAVDSEADHAVGHVVKLPKHARIVRVARG